MKSKRIKLIITLSILLVLLFTIMNIYTSYSNIRQSVEESIAIKTTKSAESIAASMDIDTYKEFLAEPSMDERYWEIRSYLNDAREKIGALYVYTLKIDNPEISRGMIMGMPADDKHEYPIGIICTLPTEQVQQAYEGNTYFSSVIKDETYNVSYLSVGAPIYDKEKQIIGYIGIDISTDVIDSVGHEVLWNSIPTFIFNGIIVVLLVITFTLIQRWYQHELKKEIGDTEDTYYKESQSLLSSVKSLRHDFINHIQVLHGLLKVEKHKQAYEYVTHLFHEAQTFSTIQVSVDNPVLSVFFQKKKLAAQNRGINLHLEINHDTFRTIKTTDLVKILSNLLDNSMDATEQVEEKDREVHVNTEIDSEHYVIQIRNTGLKIANVEQIFVRGYTTKRTTSNQGRGQGLSIVKEMVTKYGGQILIESTDQLTTATVRIPVKQ
ncbi:ATP-binding protein [Bacillus pinisoli]|uniref:ATP-binding protein n=1 Tax=Bacillus pinisoli TaxID=2901866 RepID=UPI001FF6A5DF|nr:ATP-binding protein [Bacillus pinisoli]